MNTRLQRFLELEQLSPARLADILGIQRSGVSHLLSGRNKPGFDFFYKMNKKFPTLNLEWLISGNGKVYKDVERNLFNNELLNEKSVKEKSEPQYEQLFAKEEYKTDVAPTMASENSINESELKDSPVKKSLEKILLIYSDGTFKELSPAE